MKYILIVLFSVLSIWAKESISLKNGTVYEVVSHDTASIFDDMKKRIACTIIKENGWKEETFFDKSEIESLDIYGKNISWSGTLLSTIDTSVSIFDSKTVPKQGAYRSLAEIMHNSPSAYVTPYEVKSEAEILAWRETRFAAHTLDTLEVKWIVGDCAKEHIVAYSTGDSLFFGNPERMYHLNLHPKFSWYEAKSVVKVINNVESLNPMSPFGIRETKNVGMRAKIFLVNMKSGDQKKLTKDFLIQLLGKYDKNLLAQFKKQKKKNEHLKEYFLKLLESLDKA